MMTTATGYVDKPMRKQFILFWGTAAQFCYVGAQVSIAAYFINYFAQARPDLDTTAAHIKGANFYAIAQGLFAAGRFAAAGLMYVTKPRYILLVFQSAIILFICLAIGLNTGGATRANWGGLSMLMIVLFFESCIFPTIFTLSLRGLGRHTKRGASFLVASICGGAVIPAILGNVADKTGTRVAMVVPLAFFCVAWSFPLYLNVFKGKELDAYRDSHVGTAEGVVDPDSRIGSISSPRSTVNTADLEKPRISTISNSS